jgi:hypothetical protein
MVHFIVGTIATSFVVAGIFIGLIFIFKRNK